jgi:hypothetical protein
MEANQQLLTARHLLSRALGIIEFSHEEFAPSSGVMFDLCGEIRQFLDAPTLESGFSTSPGLGTECEDPCGTVEGHGPSPGNKYGNEEQRHACVSEYQASPARNEIRSCNRHSDCDAAEAKLLAANPGRTISLNFHCRDECCEECFGN